MITGINHITLVTKNKGAYFLVGALWFRLIRDENTQQSLQL